MNKILNKVTTVIVSGILIIAILLVGVLLLSLIWLGIQSVWQAIM